MIGEDKALELGQVYLMTASGWHEPICSFVPLELDGGRKVILHLEFDRTFDLARFEDLDDGISYVPIDEYQPPTAI